MADHRHKPTIAVHKFSSCDGCQLSLLNLGDNLLKLAERVDFVHFAEAGPVDEEADVDIALVEGSISTPHEAHRIKAVRAHSKFLVTIGACATSGGLQALRNINDAGAWAAAVYAHPEHISLLDKATPISDHVSVDAELWGCPVNSHQVLALIRGWMAGVTPPRKNEKLCSECKRINTVCVMVTRGVPCMGPVTKTGCGVLCPTYGRDCYACYGPAENSNPESLIARFGELGLSAKSVKRRFLSINANAPTFARAAIRVEESGNG